MNKVDLGYLETCENWQVESRVFPSKAGGKPAWLNLENVPNGKDLTCSTCEKPLIFLCQIYAPYEDDEENFHRTLFIFICRDSNCCIRNNSSNILVLRSSLRRQNDFYSFDPPIEGPDSNFSLTKWLNLCEVCGCIGDKKCSKCKMVTYCSREHQIIDWKENHKKNCGTETTRREQSEILFPEFEIVIETEEIPEKIVDETEENMKYLKLEEEGKLGTMSNVSEKELNEHSVEDKDKTFTKFRKRIDNNPEQILRYMKGGEPLFISNENKPDNIPNCEHCGSPRQFEFQIMPQMLTLLKINDIDWGILLIYSCKKSCTNDGNINYKKEYIFKQDISMIDI